MNKEMVVRVSSLVTYLLRHNLKGLEISEGGFVTLDRLGKVIQSIYPWACEEYIRQIVDHDEEGRYFAGSVRLPLLLLLRLFRLN